MAFKGNVALVTGGASGMGRLAARTLAAQGKRVAALDVNEPGLVETAAGHEGIRTWRVDVTDPQAVAKAAEEIEAQLGPIDRVMHAAAIMPFGKLLEQDAQVIHRIMSINYGGLVNIAKATLPRMVERKRGDFVSFASMAGIIPTLLCGAYNASKFAVVAFTEVLYHENRSSGVRFACVCPPAVETPLLEQGRATAWPKLLERDKPIDPKRVLDAIESTLESGKFWVFPTREARIGAFMRRIAPNLVWKQVHDVEGW